MSHHQRMEIIEKVPEKKNLEFTFFWSHNAEPNKKIKDKYKADLAEKKLVVS